MDEGRKLKIGTLADLAGLTVRTIRYYDEIGLLTPARRMASGYRLYGQEEILRLQKIRTLKYLGFSLEEIKGCLDDPEYDMERIIRRQMEQVRAEIAAGFRLLSRLEKIDHRLQNLENIAVLDITQTIKMMTMFEKYYTSEQLEYLKQRREKLGEARIEESQQEWKTLIEQVRKEMENGTDPKSEVMQELAARWEALIEEFTGGDPGIRQSLADMYRGEGTEKASQGFLNSEVGQFMKKAMGQREKD